MHEFSLFADLIRKMTFIAEQHRARRINRVTVWLGALSQISADHFQEHFQQLTQSTLADGAELTVEVGNDINDPNAQEIFLKSVEIEE